MSSRTSRDEAGGVAAVDAGWVVAGAGEQRTKMMTTHSKAAYAKRLDFVLTGDVL
jgi:hypothetical protein